MGGLFSDQISANTGVKITQIVRPKRTLFPWKRAQNIGNEETPISTQVLEQAPLSKRDQNKKN